MPDKSSRGRLSGMHAAIKSDLAEAVNAEEFVPSCAGAPAVASVETPLAALSPSSVNLTAPNLGPQGASTALEERGTRTASANRNVRKPRSGSSETNLLTIFLEGDYRERWRAGSDLVARSLRNPASGLPFNVNQYHSLLPLESTSNASATATVYKAISAEDGRPYALRRYLGPMLARSDNVVRAFRNYNAVIHPNIVRLQAAFTTGAFAALDLSRHLAVAGADAAMSENGCRAGGHPSDLELVFVYDMYPTAKTMHEYYLHGDTSILPEEFLWVLALQLVSAVQALHEQYRLCAYGAIGAHHVLVVSPNRLKLNKIGIAAAFDPDDEDILLSKIGEYQRQDWIALSELLLALAARSNPRAVRSGSVRDLQAALETIRTAYSPDVERFLHCLANPSQISSEGWNRLLTMRLWRSYDLALSHGDLMETIAQDASSDGNLFVVGTKLAFVTERTDLAGDPQWSEIGDRYLLKLFRDRVFHDTELDLERVRDELRRLNAGTEERILLESRDGRSRLIVTYADLARFLEAALRELALRLATQNGPG
ncbi:hypothetical protein CCYA_CCYA11G3042 [Cyanidiococcus yangmingshanensis]|nr:hypothetical protein CCYA_CCYA11G3042 [Cyanidiococcus yangmingshanensis]